MSYSQALVYHDRDVREHTQLDAIIDASLRTDRERQEIDMVRRSYADVLRNESRNQGIDLGRLTERQEMLVKQLTAKFGELPEAMQTLVMNTTDSAQLETWLLNFATSEHLDDVGISTQP